MRHAALLGQVQGLGVHMGQHQQPAGRIIGNDRGDQPVRIIFRLQQISGLGIIFYICHNLGLRPDPIPRNG